MKPMIRTLAALALGAAAYGQVRDTHEKLHAALWAQTAQEYRAAALQAYRSAREQLDRALADPQWTAAVEQTGAYRDLPPAMIVDVDETILDNSPSQARMIQRRDSPPFIGPGPIRLPTLVASTQWSRSPRIAWPVMRSDSP